jgi:PAS domain S-box-containing protein
MGEKITRPVSAELSQAKFLKEALQRGTPALSRSQDRSPDSADALAAISGSAEEQRAYLQQLIECAPEAISIVDTESQITCVNREFTRMFGFGSVDATGRHLDSLIVPPDRQSEARWIHEVLMHGQNLRLETKRQRKDDTALEIFLSAAPVVVSGKPIAAYVLHRDISDQKRAEALNSAFTALRRRPAPLMTCSSSISRFMPLSAS